MRLLIIKLIHLYQLSEPVRVLLYTSIGISTSACRHNPTCSNYSIQAISRYGTIHGVKLAIKRILTCHPFSPQS